MLQEFRSTVHNKQSESESIRTRRFEAVKGLKDIFQLLRCHADPGIVNLDANARTVATASQKNLPALFSEFHSVAREVAHDASQQDWLTCDYCLRLNHSQLNAFLGCKFRDIPLNRRKQRTEPNGNQNELRGLLMDV